MNHQRAFIISSGLAVALGASACADPCIDDGLLQDPVSGCAPIGDGSGASEGSSGDGSESNTADETGAGSLSGGGTGDGSGDGGSPWQCRDADGDGFGDPDQCMQVPPNTAGWVEDDTDCDDTSATTYPGAAEQEPNDPGACRKDDDDDGWGDADPDHPGVVFGSDCRDANAQLSPSTMTLTAFVPYVALEPSPEQPRVLASIDVPLAPPSSRPTSCSSRWSISPIPRDTSPTSTSSRLSSTPTAAS